MTSEETSKPRSLSREVFLMSELTTQALEAILTAEIPFEAEAFNDEMNGE